MRPPTESRPRRVSPTASWGLFVALLIVPGIALSRLTPSVDYRIISGWMVIVSLTTIRLYWLDKRAAEGHRWRVPEATLHLCELLGGWPAAFVAQRLFRHKTVKLSYQLTFWLIVVVHQIIALDVLLGGQMCRRLLGPIVESTTRSQSKTTQIEAQSPLPIVVPGPAGRDRL